MATQQEKEIATKLKAFKAEVAKYDEVSYEGDEQIDNYFEVLIAARAADKTGRAIVRKANRVLIQQRNMLVAQHTKAYFDMLEFNYTKRELSAVMDSVINLLYGISEVDVRNAVKLYRRIFDTDKHLSDMKKTILNVGQLPTYSRWINGNPIGDITGRADSNTGKEYSKRLEWFAVPDEMSSEMLTTIHEVVSNNQDLLAVDFRNKCFNLIHNQAEGKWLIRNTEFRTYQLVTLITFGRFKLMYDFWMSQADRFE